MLTVFILTKTQRNKEHGNAAKFNPYSDEDERVRYTHCCLLEGDALFIPAYYWHFVVSTTCSFAVNFWIYPHVPSARDKFGVYFEITKQDILFHIEQLLLKEGNSKYSLALDENISHIYFKCMRGGAGKGGSWDQFFEEEAKPKIVDVIMSFLKQTK